MQAGQKRKASVLAAAAPPDGTQAAVQPAPRRLRSNAQAALQSEPEPPPAGAPAAVSTPARARRRASKAASACKVEEPSEAPAAVTTPSAKPRARRQARAALAGPVLAPLPVAPCKLEEQPAWTRESIAAAAAHLQRIDSRLAPLVAEHGWPERLLPGPVAGHSAFTGLSRTIVGQQLSWQVARVIFARVQDAACAGATEDELLDPEAVLGVSPAGLRACGLSERKASYILDLAGRFASGALSTERITRMDDAALFAELSAIKGIGRWSVDMFAMFHCGRPDILPVGDLAVRKGFQTLYALPAPPSVEEMEALAEPWRPFRSLGSYFMWKVPAGPKAPRTPKKAPKARRAGVAVKAEAAAAAEVGGVTAVAVAAAAAAVPT